MRSYVIVCGAALLSVLAGLPAFAQSQDGQTEDSQSAEAQTQNSQSDGSQPNTPISGNGDGASRVDPARITPRLFVRNEFRERRDGSRINILEALYSQPLSDKVALRVQVPLVTNSPVQAGSNTGLGDITARLAYRVAVNEGDSYFLAVEGRFDTASEPNLGVGKYLLSPVAFAAISVPEYKSFFFPLVQTVFTVGGDDTRPDIIYTVFKGNWFRILENRYYLFFEPALFINHERSNKSTGTLEVELGRFVNPKTMLYARPGVGLWGETDSPLLFEWNFEVGFRYFFR